MVKLEGWKSQLEIVEALAHFGIASCAHLGLQPQMVNKMGGYRVQGKAKSAAAEMLATARELQAAGTDLLLLECVPAPLAAQITDELDIPVIGIGAGPDVDGQILVLQDILDITTGKRPKFSKNFMQGQNSIKRGKFPDRMHSFS